MFMTQAAFTDSLYSKIRTQYRSGQMQEDERQRMLFEPFGESPAVFKCLIYLQSHKDDAEPGKMADSLHMLRQSVTVIADHLEKEGYIERKSHPSDRRKILLVLTDKGAALERNMSKVYREYHSKITSNFTEEEISTYIALRDKMNAAKDKAISEILERRNSK